VISDAGRIVGTYNKQKLYGKEAHSYTSGKDFLVISIKGMKCGFLICYDSCFPVLYDTYRKKGVQLIFHSCYNVSGKPKPVLRDLSLAQIRTRAVDNKMWISDSNHQLVTPFRQPVLHVQMDLSEA
jgi:predicted amidohydrolase